MLCNSTRDGVSRKVHERYPTVDGRHHLGSVGCNFNTGLQPTDCSGNQNPVLGIDAAVGIDILVVSDEGLVEEKCA
jgi:hypothetical protein